MREENLPIGVFDSGVGGISVLRSLVEQMPNENYIYFGDSANAPYGTRPEEEVRRLTLANAVSLRKMGVKALVIACNTATSAAISALRSEHTDIPVVGIEPALKPAVMVKKDALVLVMATPATVAGEKFKKLMCRFEKEARIQPVACPGLMEFVENGETGTPEVKALLERLLGPYLSPEPDAIVLGCTHYPFLKKAIREVAGEGPVIIDGGEGTARQTCRLLEEAGTRSTGTKKGSITFYMTLPGKDKLCRRLLETGC